MAIQLDIWQLVSLLLGFFTCVAGFGKLILTQIDRRLDQRFEAQDSARLESSANLRSALDAHLRDESTLIESVAELSSRLSRVEASAAASPSHEDLRKLYERINRVAEGQSRMEGMLSGISDTQRLMLSKITERGMQ